ncbi:MAG TPA: MATE family efflux transporter [Polyangiaceae bacterium]|nr:MATE family efflux transporter [Polyangiaceae bacterium]
MSVHSVQLPVSNARSFRELVSLAWPITVSTLSFSVMTVVDTAFVGRLGSAALAGVGLGGIALWTVICFGFGLLRAVKVLVSQHVGAGERDGEVLPYLAAGVYAALALSALSLLVGFPIAHWLPRFSASPEAGVVAETYLSIRLLGAPIVLVSGALREARYGFGDSRSPMYAALVSNAVHIPLNYVLIFGLGWGIAGAAYATLVVQLLELGWLYGTQRKFGLGFARARFAHVRAVFRIGLPTGSEFLLGVAAFSALVLLIARMGEADLAAHQVAIQILHFAFMPTVAIGEAASVLAGRAVGADDDKKVFEVAKNALWLAGLYAGACALIFVFGAQPLMRLFTGDPSVQAVGVHLLYVAAGFQLFDAANIVARAVLRGTGDVRIPALLAIGSGWSFVPGLTWFWGIHHGFGAVGGWLALTVDISVGALLFWWRLSQGHWLAAAKRSRQRLAQTEALVQPAE